MLILLRDQKLLNFEQLFARSDHCVTLAIVFRTFGAAPSEELYLEKKKKHGSSRYSTRRELR